MSRVGPLERPFQQSAKVGAFGLIHRRERGLVALGNQPDFRRHGRGAWNEREKALCLFDETLWPHRRVFVRDHAHLPSRRFARAYLGKDAREFGFMAGT
jgi:hypothetical protein